MIDRVSHSVVSWVVNLYPLHKWGLPMEMSSFIVKNLGPRGALWWMVTKAPNADKLRKGLGYMRANLVLALASLLNGCSYCLYAHARAFELYYFEKFDKLFPLSQHEFLELIPLTDADARKRLEDALVEAGLPDEVPIFHRLYALKLEGATPTKEDELLVTALEYYDFLNFCAIDGQLELDDAHDIINLKSDLKRRYAEARLAQGRKPVSAETINEVAEQRRIADGGTDGSSG